MPIQWLEVLSHPTTKDKASLLMELKYEMTIDDVYDLLEYQDFENWRGHEDYLNSKKEK